MLRGLIAGLDRELDMLLNDEYAAIKRDELKRGKVKMKKMWHVCHFSNFPVSEWSSNFFNCKYNIENQYNIEIVKYFINEINVKSVKLYW